MGAIHTYTTDGQFIKRNLLPAGGETDMIGLYSTPWRGGAKIKKTSIFTDEYMISVVSPEEIGRFHKSLPAEEFCKVKDLPEDANFCLVKYYFK